MVNLNPSNRLMKLIEFNVESPYYRASCRHRNRILRQPLGLSLWREDLSLERSQRHFGVLEEGGLTAGLIIVPLSDQKAKLRQMWVLEHKRGQGIGQFLITEVEKALIQKSLQTINLAARVSCMGFYEKLGFKVVGNEFEEVGLPHQQMEKMLGDLDWS